MRLFNFIMLITAIPCLSCTASLKPYEQVYINDPEMQMETDASQNFQNYVQSIREGATPVSSPKSSGGCGCN